MNSVYKVKNNKHEKLVIKPIAGSNLFDTMYHTKHFIAMNYGDIDHIKDHLAVMIKTGGTSIEKALTMIELVEGADVLGINQ